MLVSISNILIILVLIQCVISVEFYKSKRVPPKYKELRRKYSIDNKAENYDEKQFETIVKKDTDHEEIFIGDIPTTVESQSSSPTSTIKPKRRTFKLRSLKIKEENSESKPVEIFVNENNNQYKTFIDNVRIFDDKQNSRITTTVNPKTRTFNVRPFKNKGANATSEPIRINIKETTEQDELSIGNAQTTENKKSSVIDGLIQPKTLTFNLLTLRNKEQNAESELVETFVDEDTNQDKLFIGNLQTTDEKEPRITTSTLQLNSRTINLESLKRKDENIDSNSDETFANEDTDQDKISIGNVQTTENKKPSVITNTNQPKIRTYLSTLKNKGASVGSKPAETSVNENTSLDKLSIGNVQITENKQPSITTISIETEKRLLNLDSLKNEEENLDIKSVETIVNEDTDKDKISIGNTQTTENKKPSVTTSKIKPIRRTFILRPLKIQGINAESKHVETFINENTEEEEEEKVTFYNGQTTKNKKLSTTNGTIQTERRLLKLDSLKNEDEKVDSKSVETIGSEYTEKDLISIGNVQTTENRKPSVTSKIQPIRRTFNLRALKNKGANAESKSAEIFVDEKTDKGELYIDNAQTIGNKKPSSSTSKIQPIRRTFNLRALTIKGVNSESKHVETFVNENTKEEEEDKVSFDNEKTTENKKLSTTTSTIQTERRLLNLDSLKNEEENINSKSLETIVNENTDENKISVSNVQNTENKKSSVNTSKIQAIRRTFNLRSLKNKGANADSKSAESFVNENTDKDKLYIDNVQTIRNKKPSVSTSALQLKSRTFKRRPLKVKGENGESEHAETLVNENTEKREEDTVSFDNEHTTENKKLSTTTSTIPTEKRFSNLDSLKSKEENIDNAPIETFDNEDTDQDKIFIGIIQNTENKKLSVTTSTLQPKRRTFNLRPLKNKGANAGSRSAEIIVNKNTEKDKLYNDNEQTIENKKPSVSTSTIQFKSRTFNRRPLKVKGIIGESEHAETFVNENTEKREEDTVSLDNEHTNENKKISTTTSIIQTEKRLLNLDSLKSKEENIDNASIETFDNEDTDQDKIAIGIIQTTENKKPGVTTSKTQPKRRTFNLRPLKNTRANAESRSAEIIVNKNTEKDKLYIDNEPTIENKKPNVSTSTIQFKSRTFNRRPLKIKGGSAEIINLETFVNKNTEKDKVSINNEQTNENKQVSVTTSTIQTKRRLLNIDSLKDKEENINRKYIETFDNDNSEQDKISIGNKQTNQNKTPSITTSTIQPKRRTFNPRLLTNKGANAKSKSAETFVDENTDKDKLYIDNVQTIENKQSNSRIKTIQLKSRTFNRRPLKIKAVNDESKNLKTFDSENTEQDKVSFDNEQTTENKKLSTTTSTIQTEKRLLNFDTLKNKEDNIDNKSVETFVIKNVDEDKISVGNVQSIENKKSSATISTTQPKRRTFNLRPLKNNEANFESKPIETFANENTDQYKVSSGNVRTTLDKKLSVTFSTIQPERPTSDLDSFKNKKVNSEIRSLVTFGNENIDEDKISNGSVETTSDKKPNVTTTVQSKSRSLNIDPFKNKDKESSSKTVEKFIKENFEKEKLTLTTTVKPTRRTLNVAEPAHGSTRTMTIQRKIEVQEIPQGADSKSNLSNRRTVLHDFKYDNTPVNFSQKEVTVTQPHQSYEKYYQSTTPSAKLEKTRQQHETFVPIVGVENYVYAHSGDYHYSYEGGDGTKAFERGEVMPADGSSHVPGVVGGYSYKDKDGNDFSLTYTAGEGGYQPVGAHLPTPPPIPPAIQRVLRILATKTTPEPVTEKINSRY